MGTIITFPAERRPPVTSLAQHHFDGGSVIILPVIRIERVHEAPSDNLEPGTSSPRGKRRKR